MATTTTFQRNKRYDSNAGPADGKEHNHLSKFNKGGSFWRNPKKNKFAPAANRARKASNYQAHFIAQGTSVKACSYCQGNHPLSSCPKLANKRKSPNNYNNAGPIHGQKSERPVVRFMAIELEITQRNQIKAETRDQQMVRTICRSSTKEVLSGEIQRRISLRQLTKLGKLRPRSLILLLKDPPKHAATVKVTIR